MITAVADTHAAIWYLSGDTRLSSTARQAIDEAFNEGNNVAISSISLVEMVYLVEKGRIPAGRFTQLANELENTDSVFVEVSVTLALARHLSRIPASDIPDMPDRLIAATGIALGVPVISRDSRIQTSEIETIW